MRHDECRNRVELRVDRVLEDPLVSFDDEHSVATFEIASPDSAQRVELPGNQ